MKLRNSILLKATFSLFALLAGLTVLPHEAQSQAQKISPACDVIDAMSQTQALAQAIQSEGGDNSFQDNIAEIEGLANRIYLPELFPEVGRETFQSETKAVIQFMASLRQAVISAQLGYNEAAKKSLGQGTTPQLSGSLRSLELYWNCQPQNQQPQNKAQNRTDRSDLFNAPQSVGKTAQTDQIESEGKSPVSRSTRATNNQLLGDPNYFPGGEFISNPFALMFMGLLFLLGLLILAFRRKRRFEAREERRFIRLPIKVRIDETEHDMVVLDISMSGMKLQHLGSVKPRDKLRIKLNGSWYIGHAQWSNDSFAGIRFQRPLQDATLDAIAKA